MFFTDDVKGDYERINSRGAEFTMPPTEVTGSTIAMLNGHLRQPGPDHAVGTLVALALARAAARRTATPV